MLKAQGMRFAKTKLGLKQSASEIINIGYGTTIDCAVLIAAQELGLFRKHGLNVQLSREVGWTTIREKLMHGELNIAATHAGMLFSIYCGLGGAVRRPCLTAMLLGRNGSAITLSKDFPPHKVRDAATLGKIIHARKSQRRFTFGIVHELSTQNLNLRAWLKGGGIDPDHDVSLVVIPSALMHEMLSGGFLDGYCVAEPWNTAAAARHTGWVVAATSEVSPHHPEKVLLTMSDFAEKREEEHLRIIAALIEASQYCNTAKNRPELARMLARPKYFDVDASLLTRALQWQFEIGHNRPPVDDFVVYDALKYGAPTHEAGKWVFDLVRQLESQPTPALHPEIIPTLFREDLFHKAASLVNPVRRTTNIAHLALCA